MKARLNVFALQAWRAGVLAGITALLWMGNQFVTRREYDLAWGQHNQLRDETLARLLADTREVRDSVRRVETILLNRQRADAANTAMGKRTP